MNTIKLYNTGEEYDGMRVHLCIAKKGELVAHTCVRADNAAPRGSFREQSSPLFQIDLGVGYAWVWRTLPSLGEITAEQRLRLLLGEEVTVNEWVLKAW